MDTEWQTFDIDEISKGCFKIFIFLAILGFIVGILVGWLIFGE